MTGLRTEGLVLEKGAARLLDGAELRVAPGETLTLMGPSGAGKSSMLRCIAGLERPTAGSVTWTGDDGSREVWSGGRAWTPPERRRIGMVAQDLALWPHRTAVEHLLFVLALRGVSRAAAPAIAADLLGRVGLGALAERRPSELSGGEAQRLAVARALCGASRVVLLDEPFAHLDVLLRAEISEVVRRLAHGQHAAVVHVTHEPDDALGAPGRVAVIENGRIVQDGVPRVLAERPGTRFVASVTGRVNFIDAHGAPTFLAGAGVAPGDPRFARLPDGSLAFAPSAVRAAPPGSGVRAVAGGVRWRGGSPNLVVSRPDCELLVPCPSSPPPAGTAIWIAAARG